MRPEDARMLSPLVLAYVGDSVYDLYVRTRLSRGGGRVHALHRAAVERVCCKAQAAALTRLERIERMERTERFDQTDPMDRIHGPLTDLERDVVRRGRNCHAHHAAPRGADKADYALSTGLEALLGYLHLTGQAQRLSDVLALLDEDVLAGPVDPADPADSKDATVYHDARD
jgi:ribonuclease-3 family protein